MWSESDRALASQIAALTVSARLSPKLMGRVMGRPVNWLRPLVSVVAIRPLATAKALPLAASTNAPQSAELMSPLAGLAPQSAEPASRLVVLVSRSAVLVSQWAELLRQSAASTNALSLAAVVSRLAELTSRSVASALKSAGRMLRSVEQTSP